MGKKLFVGNLSFDTSSDDLKSISRASAPASRPRSSRTGPPARSRGFGFVEMSSSDEAERAVADLNGQELQGRKLTVSEAREQSRPGGGGGGGGGGGRGGYGGGGGGRRYQAATRSDMTASAPVASRRRRFWGWGWEDGGPSPEHQQAIARVLAARFGVETSTPLPPPRSTRSPCRPPR